VERALLDLWHADEHGEYDNAGFRYRGHIFTDSEGRYRFRTITPGVCPGRTRHYHIKVQAPERPVLTTQLYFADEPANRRDGLFRRELVMRIGKLQTASQRDSILSSTYGNESSTFAGRFTGLQTFTARLKAERSVQPPAQPRPIVLQALHSPREDLPQPSAPIPRTQFDV
jgi:hypothetical protein